MSSLMELSFVTGYSRTLIANAWVSLHDFSICVETEFWYCQWSNGTTIERRQARRHDSPGRSAAESWVVSALGSAAVLSGASAMLFDPLILRVGPDAGPKDLRFLPARTIIGRSTPSGSPEFSLPPAEAGSDMKTTKGRGTEAPPYPTYPLFTAH